MPIILRRSRLSRVLATLLMLTGLVLQPQPVAHSLGPGYGHEWLGYQ